jgi:arylsulfatase A-like enzyme
VRWLREPDGSVKGESDELDDIPFAQLVAMADKELVDLSRDRESSWLLWLESSGIGWPGLATSQFVELYAGELEEDLPAELLAIREIEVAYAALLTQFDHLLGRLLAEIERLFGDAPPLLVLVAAQGESVCEAEMLSSFAEQSAVSGGLRDEWVHAPLIVVGATGETLGSRRLELVTPLDVLPTLGEWFGYADLVQANPGGDVQSLGRLLRNEDDDWRSEIVLQDDEGHAAVRTAEFLYVANIAEQLASAASGDLSDQDGSVGSLFLKPEDVWEVNDVAQQLPEQVVTLRAALMDRLRSQRPE